MAPQSPVLYARRSTGGWGRTASASGTVTAPTHGRGNPSPRQGSPKGAQMSMVFTLEQPQQQPCRPVHRGRARSLLTWGEGRGEKAEGRGPRGEGRGGRPAAGQRPCQQRQGGSLCGGGYRYATGAALSPQ